MTRLSSLALLVVSSVCVSSFFPAPAQRPVPRGVYHRNEEPPFEIWIPRGLTERKQDAASLKVDVLFCGRTSGAHQIGFRFTSAYPDLPTFVTAVKNSLDSQFTRCTVEVHSDEKSGGRNAVIIHAKDLEGDSRLQGQELLRAGILLSGETIFTIGMFLDKGNTERAFEQLRWMMSTLKRPGEKGLDPYLQPRRMDRATGLSFRPPRGFDPIEKAEDANPVFTAENREAGMRFSLHPSDRTAIEKVLRDRGKGLDRSGRSRTFPHAGSCRLVGAIYREPKDSTWGRVIVAAKFEKSGRCFALEVAGPLEARESLIRTAELAGMGLDHVDLVAARAAVDQAAPALEAARRNRKTDQVKAELEVLARYPFLEKAASGMARCITQVDDRSTQVQVAKALAGADTDTILPDLIKDIRHFQSKKRHDVVAALLTALGSVQGPRAVPVLFKFARRGTGIEAAAAVRALGHYEIKKDRVVKDVISLMRKAESAARKADHQARERWLEVGPAFREALKRLTGRRFTDAAQAEAWLRSR